MSIRELIKLRINWVITYYLKWTLIPTWKYWYNINLAFEEGSQWEKALKNEIRILRTYVERTETERDALNIIALKQKEHIRELRSEIYDLVQRFGIIEEILVKNPDWTWLADYIYQIQPDESQKQEIGENSGSSQEERQDTAETPRD